MGHCRDSATLLGAFKTFQSRLVQFGLTSAPSTFQRMMHGVVTSLPFAKVYPDDV